MNTHDHHEELMRGVSAQFAQILKSSQQAVYIYLDDLHKVCNQKFASLLGYASPTEWAAVQDPFPEVFVGEESREVLVGAYQAAVQEFTGSTFKATWKKNGGGSISTTVVMVPIVYDEHVFALHFISQ